MRFICLHPATFFVPWQPILAKSKLHGAESAFGVPVQKYLPLDLREKKTRAIRRRLTKHQVMHQPLSLCLPLKSSACLCKACFCGQIEISTPLGTYPVQLMTLHGSIFCKSMSDGHAFCHADVDSWVTLLQASLKTEKQVKKDRAFPKRKFAVKA